MSHTINDTNIQYYYYSQLQQLSSQQQQQQQQQKQQQQQQQQRTDCNNKSSASVTSVQVQISTAVITTTTPTKRKKVSIKTTCYPLVAPVIVVAVVVAFSVVDSLTFVSYNKKFITAVKKTKKPLFLNPSKLLSSSSSSSLIAIIMNPSSNIILSATATATNVNEESNNNNNNNTNTTEVVVPADTSITTTVKRVQIDQQQQEEKNDNNNKRLKVDASLKYETIKQSMIERTNGMNERHQNNIPLTNNEIQDIIQSIQSISSTNDNKNSLNTIELTKFLQSVGHLSHKDWSRTNENGNILATQLLNLQFTTTNNNSTTTTTTTISSNESTTNDIRTMFKRVIIDGNWDNAVQYTIQNNLQIMADGSNYFVHPWIVLVTGVNGIRKTTSIYQEWFPKLLKEAIIDSYGINIGSTIDIVSLPVGTNSFFRQLDHIIATICNKDFTILYQYVYDLLLAYNNNNNNNNETDKIQQSSSSTTSMTSDDTSVAQDEQHQQLLLEKILQNDPPEEIIQLYSNLKAAIFTRYRTISELIGIYLLKEGQMNSMNCMVETSGRDIAMYEYIDYLYPAHTMYKKLVLHFTINDLSYAQKSVDTRMINEIHSGIRAITTTTTSSSTAKSSTSSVPDVQRIIQTNLGGPYGSEVLPSVQHDSESVWNKIIQKQISIPNSDNVIGHDWYKASIQINAKPIQVQQQTAVDGQEQIQEQQYEPWTAQAILPDGTLGKEFTFK